MHSPVPRMLTRSIYWASLVSLVSLLALTGLSLAEEAPAVPAMLVQAASAPVVAEATSSPAPAVTIGSASAVPEVASSAPAVAEVPPAPPPEPEGCRPLTLKAMSADVKAFNAQAQKLDLAEQARLFDEVLLLWEKAVAQCEGHPKEQAQHNLANSQKARNNIAEQLGSGPQCVATIKDAESLQNMAKQALSERRWNDASILFLKSESLWDMATEDCSGRQQEQAYRRRSEAGIDGHNAEFCAPLFDKAREQTQKLRSSQAQLSPEDKQNQSMVAETLWREAMEACKGDAVKDIARNNAQALARERGTLWVARALPNPSSQAVPVAQKAGVGGPQAGAPGIPQPSQTVPRDVPVAAPPLVAASTSGKQVEPAASSGSSASAIPSAAAGLMVSAFAAQPPAPSLSVAAPTSAQPVAQESPAKRPPPAKLTEFNAEDAKGLSTYSGPGKVVWGNGDVYEGDLVQGLRQGKGSFNWKSGQRYEGDWVHDRPQGQGSIKFANGNQYEGGVSDAVPQGQGRMQYASGDSYVGNFTAGSPDGQGIYTWKNGQKYEGGWKNFRPSGQGRMWFASGESYVGHYVNGEPEGEGEYLFANGDKYTGSWKAGKKQGAGRTQFASGELYVGNYVDGQADGEGEYTFSNGDKYVGHWKAGSRHGQGAYIWKNGERWDGIFENNERVVQDKPTPAN